MAVPLTLVVNPAAGGGRAGQFLPAVLAVLDSAGATYAACQGSSLEGARSLAAQAAAQGHLVVAVGGDGMVSAVAGAVSQAKQAGEATFAVIPAGRGNDLARSLGIPTAPGAAAQVLLTGQRRAMDLIRITGADGTQMIAAGSVYAGIAAEAGHLANTTRLIRGPLVYPAAALRALASWKPATFRVDGAGPARDGSPAGEQFAGYGLVVANLPYFGAGMKIAPDADPGDGQLDVVLMRHAPKLTFLRVLTRIKDGSHVQLRAVGTSRAAALSVTFDARLRTGIDGETLNLVPPLHIKVLPAALGVMVPL